MNQTTFFLRNMIFRIVTPAALSVALLCAAAIGVQAQGARQYTAIGDSLTFGIGAGDPLGTGTTDPNDDGFVPRVSRRLNAVPNSFNTTNRGIPGAQTTSIISDQLPGAVADNPHLVTITIGANDTLQTYGAALQNPAQANQIVSQRVSQFFSEYNTILNNLRNVSNSPLFVVINVPNLSIVPRADDDPATATPGDGYAPTPQAKQFLTSIVVRYNQVIADFTREYKIRVIDIYSDPRAYILGNFSADLFHPNPAGYAILANNYFLIINRAAPFDFDGDGRADLSAYRPSNNTWQITPSNAANSFYGVQWGAANDRLTPADYDNDGRNDIAVYRNGIWYILQSSNNQVRYGYLGASGDQPVQADYDGDAVIDLAVYRPTSGEWFYQSSVNANQLRGIRFGASGDIPVVANLSGDGGSDFVVFRPSIGRWYSLSSSNFVVIESQFGQSGDIPLAGNFTGGSRDDFAVFRPSTNSWIIARTTGLPATNFDSYQFGATGDIPVPADYDGDGRQDLAVYRNGTWIVFQSLNGQIRYSNFGAPTDRPIAAAVIQ